MRDADQMKKLRKRYIQLVEMHGEEVAEFKSFKKSLLDQNRAHRQACIKTYTKMISKIEKSAKND